jgi:hypothetical protein
MDIDIDIRPDTDIQKLFPTAIRSSMIEKDKMKPHIVGWHFQNVPIDKVTGLCAIPHDFSEDFHFFKIDMLNLSLLNHFENKEQMRKLLKIEPDWRLLKREDVVEKLFHLSKHYETVSEIAPTSIEELADVLALIRPNKRNLIAKYRKDKSGTRIELYKKRDPSDLRKSHAIPYAMLIVLQLHLIKGGII